MLLRLLLFLGFVFLLLRSVYRRGWALTLEGLRRGGRLFLQEAEAQWSAAKAQASQLSLEASLFPASFLSLLRFFSLLRG